MRINTDKNINKASVTPVVLHSAINTLGIQIVATVISSIGELFGMRLTFTIYLLKMATKYSVLSISNLGS